MHAEVADYLLNRKRREIAGAGGDGRRWRSGQRPVGVSPDTWTSCCLDPNGNEVRLLGGPPPRMFRGDGGRDRRAATTDLWTDSFRRPKRERGLLG